MKSSNTLFGGALVLAIFLTTLSVFFLYSNTLAQPGFDKVVLNSKSIRIQNFLKEPVLDIQLIENTDQCLADCHAIIRLHPYQRIAFPETPNDDFRWDFLKAAPQMLGLKRYHFQILENVSYMVSIQIFSNQSYDCVNNITQAHETCWEDAQTGVTEETNYRDEYQPFNFWGKMLEPGKDYYIKLIGEKYPVLGENNVDWILTIMGIQIREWGWWNGSWTKRTPIAINITQGGSPTNFQVPINVTYNSTTMRSDMGDIRFLSNCSDNATLLSYWNETTVTSGWTYFWVKVDVINATICMYYNNSLVASTANGEATFMFFDDFQDGSLNLTKWTTTYSSAYKETGGKLVMYDIYSTSTRLLNSNTSFQNFTFESLVTNNATTGYTYGSLLHTSKATYANDTEESVLGWSANQLQLKVNGSYNLKAWTPTANNYFRMITKWPTTGNVSANIYWSNGTLAHSETGNPTSVASQFIGLFQWFGGGSAGFVDFVFVRKNFYNREATVTFGSEENYTAFATESEGDTAIVQGIQNSLGPGAEIHEDQQIYIRYLNGSQLQGQFDKVTVYGNKTWAFNYITSGESKTNMLNLSTIVYVWEKDNLTAQDITSQVSSLINATKV